ncbi:MAG: molecular chaperone DnaK [Planctomycetota bacterium]
MSSESPSPRLVLGIDLGTTNSVAAVVGKKGPRVLPGPDGDPLIPSVVSFREDGTMLVGRAAKDRVLEAPERTIHSSKRLLGRSGAELDEARKTLPYPVEAGPRGLARVRIDDRQISPEEVAAQILKDVKHNASQALGADVSDVVVTVPAYFDDAQRQATKDAAELAGLNCLRVVNEPTAASLAYGIDGSKDGTILVYDLGGGTFDVSILKIDDGVFRVLATAGDTQLGGDDFDERLAGVLREKTGLKLESEDPFARQAIRRSAEALKVQLGVEDAATLEIDTGAGDPLRAAVTRAEFEGSIQDLVDRTIAQCRRALKDAEIRVDELDAVVLVGGSTRVPLVRSAIQDFSNREPEDGVDPDLAVALGAAIQADILAGGQRELLLLDVVPLSLGIETQGGVVSKLILRNATIPASVTEEFSTQVDNQSGVQINVYQGERERVEHCRKLGAFELQGLPPMPAGLPRIAVTFLIDADGLLRVSAKETRTGKEASIAIVPSFGLTRDEVSRMMNESLEHAHSDMVDRSAIELRNKANAMVTGTRKALDLAELPPDQTWAVNKAVKSVEKHLESGDLAALEKAVEDLSSRTAQIADDVVSSAVNKALREDS